MLVPFEWIKIENLFSGYLPFYEVGAFVDAFFGQTSSSFLVVYHSKLFLFDNIFLYKFYTVTESLVFMDTFTDLSE